MKNGFLIAAFSLFLCASCAAFNSSSAAGYPQGMGGSYAGSPQNYDQNYGAEMNDDYMYNYLEPYGNWINMDPYGYVWTPRNMGYRWRPYSDGHWVSTEDGWTWVANEEWGQIPFHYGRWGYDEEIGWFWVPGTEWSPAWVSWRWNDQYTGWAPLPPGSEFRDGMDYNSLSRNIPNHFWVFLQSPHFLDRDINRYTLPYERNGTIINFTSGRNNLGYRNNRVYNEGISIDFVRRATRRDVPNYRIQDSRQPGRMRILGLSIQLFRPQLRIGINLRPRTYMNRDDARRQLAPLRVFEPQPQYSVREQEAAARRRIAMERNLLERTQALELRNMQRVRAAEVARIRDLNERSRIQLERQNQINELQRQHQAERAQLNERHKQDRERVRQIAWQYNEERRAQQIKNRKHKEKKK